MKNFLTSNYVSFQWGTSFMPGADLEVERRADCFWVVGFNPYLALAQRPQLHSWDVLEQYRKTPKNWAVGRSNKTAPHVLFANADTDEKLITFLGKFGPVVAKSLKEEFPKDPAHDTVPPIRTGEQDINELRRERSLYRSVLVLLAEVRRGSTADLTILRCSISEIVRGVSDWPRQWNREQQLRSQQGDSLVFWEFSEAAVRRIESYQGWSENSRPTIGERVANTPVKVIRNRRAVNAGRHIICELVNAFKPWVYLRNNNAIEAPHWDLSYGIRPVLYHILRRQYVHSGGIEICANNQCRELFETDRAEQRFCTPDCSRRQRQREYWAQRGKALRDYKLRKKGPAALRRRKR